MNILGIGPLELLLVAVIAMIVLGPKGMVNGAREAGKTIRNVVRSPLWREVVDTSREIREFPRKIAREAGIEQDLEELRRSTQETVAEINRTHIPTIIPLAEDVKDKSDEEPEGKAQ